MAAHSSKLVIDAAPAGNSLIAVTKFAAATYTGSSALLSEAVHPVPDTGNQMLLLYGLRRSAGAHHGPGLARPSPAAGAGAPRRGAGMTRRGWHDPRVVAAIPAAVPLAGGALLMPGRQQWI